MSTRNEDGLLFTEWCSRAGVSQRDLNNPDRKKQAIKAWMEGVDAAAFESDRKLEEELAYCMDLQHEEDRSKWFGTEEDFEPNYMDEGYDDYV